MADYVMDSVGFTVSFQGKLMKGFRFPGKQA